MKDQWYSKKHMMGLYEDIVEGEKLHKIVYAQGSGGLHFKKMLRNNVSHVIYAKA